MGFRGLRRRRDRKRSEQLRAELEQRQLEQKFAKKIKVYHEARHAEAKSTFFVVEFNLDSPMSANDLLQVLMERVGDHV